MILDKRFKKYQIFLCTALKLIINYFFNLNKNLTIINYNIVFIIEEMWLVNKLVDS